jgi:hypothetical protein
VAVLLVAMGVGVLIGRGGSNQKAVGTPQVISVAAPLAGAGAATTPATPSASSTPKTPKGVAHGAGKGEASGVGNSISKPAPPTAAQELRSKNGSGQSFEQKSKNLPNVISTG